MALYSWFKNNTEKNQQGKLNDGVQKNTGMWPIATTIMSVHHEQAAESLKSQSTNQQQSSQKEANHTKTLVNVEA